MGFGSPPAGMDLFQAARAGDCARLAQLIKGGADVNAYDRWDSFPLYYACFAGHDEAARMLLEAGAIYVESSFEGERCYLGALNLGIRRLLEEYEAPPPPSQPVAAAALARLPVAFLPAFYLACYPDRAGADSASPPDITLKVPEGSIKAHRVILAARSPYFRKKLASEWRDLKEVTLPSSHSLPYWVMATLIAFFYTDMLDVSADDLEAVARVCRALEGEGLHEMANRLDARRWLCRGARTTQSGPHRRFLLQQHRLPSDLRRILQDCLANSRQEEDLHNNSDDYDDLADIRIRVGDRVFRCHRMILAWRSDYFRSRLSREHNNVLEEHDVSPEAFEKMIEYIYTDELDHLGDYPLARAEELLDVASRYMLLPLKPIVAALPLLHMDLDQVSPAQLCRWLTLSELFMLSDVREHCLDVIACNFEAFAEAKEFRALLLASRRWAAADGGSGLFHDLREKCLREMFGKDEITAAPFDERLEMLVLAAQQEANDDQGGFSSVPPRSRASAIRQIASRLMEVFCCIMPPEEESNDNWK